MFSMSSQQSSLLRRKRSPMSNLTHLVSGNYRRRNRDTGIMSKLGGMWFFARLLRSPKLLRWIGGSAMLFSAIRFGYSLYSRRRIQNSAEQQW